MMQTPRVVFMGTPDIACGILQALLTMPVSVVGVVSQPDRPVGRKKELKPTPVKAFCLEKGLVCLQPESLKASYQEVLDLQPDLIVTCAYGQWVPKVLLEAPSYGCINCHASILPKYRGGAPIHWAIIKGEKETGMTIMKMAPKMDAGDILYVKKCPITDTDTASTLFEKLMDVGQEAMKEMLLDYLEGKITPIPQKEEEATFAYNISAEDEVIRFDAPSQEVYDHIRGLISWPVGHGLIDGQMVKFHAVRKGTAHGKPGEVLGLVDGGLGVACQDGCVILDEIQQAGKKKERAKDFFNGKGRSLVGHRFE